MRSDNAIGYISVISLSLATGIVMSQNERGLIFVLLFVLTGLLSIVLLKQTQKTILMGMIGVVFFIPFNKYWYLNLYNVINPLVYLGLILFTKNFFIDRGISLIKLLLSDKIKKIYCAFLISGCLSSIYAISVKGAFNWMLHSFMTGFVVYQTILLLDQENLKELVAFLVKAASIAASWNILWMFAHGNERLSSALGHPLANGIYFATLLPLCLALYIEKRKNVYLVISGILFIAVVLTFSRGSWAALFIGMSVFFLRSRGNRKAMITLIVIIAAGALLLLTPVGGMIKNRIFEDESATYSSFNIRKNSLPIAIRVIKQKPILGYGPFNAARVKNLNATNQVMRQTGFENSYLDLIIGFGVVGMSLLVLIYVVVFKEVFLKKTPGHLSSNLLSYALSASFIILLFNMATFNFDDSRLFHFLNWLIIGLNLSFAKYEDSGEKGAV